MPKPMPLVMVDRDGVLPGEERDVLSPPLEGGAARALAPLVGKHVVVLCVPDNTFLPTFASQRWGTVCKVISVVKGVARFRGTRRALVFNATTNGPLYPAQVERRSEQLENPSGNREKLMRAAHLFFAALDSGATPLNPGWSQRIEVALFRAASGMASATGRRILLDSSLPAALDAFTRSLCLLGENNHAACALEAVLREKAAGSAGADANARLWAQVVELMKRLDISDPATDVLQGEHQVLTRKIQQAGLPAVAMEHAQRQLTLLKDMAKTHHDYAHTVTQLDLMARLPWHPAPAPPIDLAAVTRALDEGHAGLAKPKRRVLEFLAVAKLGGAKANLVLCLAGPPGVGKTSIAAAVAAALGRTLVRVPLGGIHDECEIRGHRIAFTASGPGRILQGLARAGSTPAVVLLDEIDKIGADVGRSPSHALLEVLDPEQNHAFQDNYLAVPFDLSRVLFIATANDVERIDPVLRDRLEIVEIDGYTLAEKTTITREHLMARLQRDNGLPRAPAIDDATTAFVVDGYTREAGVRELGRALSSVLRARVMALVTGAVSDDDAVKPITIEEVRAALGPPRYLAPARLECLPVGVAVALSVGAAGGAPLYVEVALLPDDGDLQLTGSLGAVMRESAVTAVAYVRANAARYGIDPARLARAVHVHFPEGGTPKEGPSAGLALVAAIVSAASGVPLRADVALTGEITLTGRVLPVGGISAKVLAAERAGMERVILPARNAAEVPEGTTIKVMLVTSVEEAVLAALSAAPSSVAKEESEAAPPSASA